MTMDAGALTAIYGHDRRVLVLLARAREAGSGVTVPASAIAQAVRRPEQQARLARLLRQPTTDVVALDRVDATNVGRLLAASGTSDVVDAHVVIVSAEPANKLSPPIQMIFGLSIQPCVL